MANQRTTTAPDSATTPKQPSAGSSEPGLNSLADLMNARRRALGITDEEVAAYQQGKKKIERPEPTAEEIAASEAREQERRHKEREKEIGDRLGRLAEDRGTRYADCALDNFKASNDTQRDAVAQLRKYAAELRSNVEGGHSVLLIGPSGTGKDHLMMALAREAVRMGFIPRWKNGQDLWAEFRDAISNEDSEARIVERYVGASILMLSDPMPPRGAITDFQSATLFRIIDARYSNMRPTWVTLNVASRQEAEERLSVQVVDRLTHDALVIACNWPSYRKART